MAGFADIIAAGGIEALRDLVTTVAVTMARPTAVFLVTPFLGKGVLTGLARNGVMLALCLPLIPALFAGRPEGLAEAGLFLVLALVLKEMLIGLLIGLPFAVLSWGLEAAGFMIDNQRGSTMASSMNPTTGDQSSPVGILLAQVYTVWMFVSGGFLALLDLLYRSYAVWAPWSLVPRLDASLSAGLLGLLDSVMLLTLLLAGPALVAMFMSEMGLALISRFAPQLQVFFLAMPLKSAVGILVLVLSLGVIMDIVGQRLLDAHGLLGAVRGWMPGTAAP
jgi:type III secretion protein T